MREGTKLSRVLENARNEIIQKYNFFSHKGIDLLKYPNKVTNILAHSAGKVTKVGQDTNYGNFIEIKHKNDYTTFYAHLKEVYVTKNEKVEQGDKIGSMGATGKTQHTHLHFEIRNKKNKRINPTKFLNKNLPHYKEEKKLEYQVYDNKNKKWLPLVKEKDNFAGIIGNEIGAIKIKADFDIKYAVLIREKWFLIKEEQEEIFENIHGFKIESTSVRLMYRIHFINEEWTNWITNLEEIAKKEKTIDAIQIKIV